jgi:hypothetical protein
MNMTINDINNFHEQMIGSRYTDATVTRAEAVALVNEVMRCWTEIARLKGEPDPFETKTEKVEREPLGFNGAYE